MRFIPSRACSSRLTDYRSNRRLSSSGSGSYVRIPQHPPHQATVDTLFLT